MSSQSSTDFKLAGVMGWPISHSRSPLIHGHWLAQYGLRGAYVPLAVNPLHLPQALSGLSALGFAGCNLTLPHKIDALACIHQLDDVARQIGAVNTVVVSADVVAVASVASEVMPRSSLARIAGPPEPSTGRR